MRYIALFSAICALISIASASTPPTFCKCTCFTNSTIIALTPAEKPRTVDIRSATPESFSSPDTLPDTSPNDNIFSKRAPPPACTRCNRAFCISLNLPICKGAEEKDITTACFQRDSMKDQVVVLGFVAVTLGLLGWAFGQEVMARRNQAEANYAPIAGR